MKKETKRLLNLIMPNDQYLIGPGKPVIEIVTETRFNSISEAAKHFGIPKSSVKRSCERSIAVSPGLKFKHLD